MKTFIAINFNEQIRTYLSECGLKLFDSGLTGNYSVKDNIHLTIKYIGETDAGCFELLKKSLIETVLNIKEFKIILSNPSYFRKGNPYIIWMGIEKSNELIALYENFISNLIKNGVMVSCDDYVPHITIGRNIKTKENLDEILKKIEIKKIEQLVTSIEIMESTRIDDKLTYISRFSVGLGGKLY